MELKQAFDSALDAMDTLGHAFSEHLDGLRQTGASEETMRNLDKGAMAMKSAAGIYLSWAQHYLSECDKASGFDPDDESMIVEE
jgi:hypothetical protein